MSAQPILYSFRRCPYAIRARLALVASGLSVELREVLLRDKPVSLLHYSPKGTVPVLLLSDGTVIDESLDIIHWTLRQSDGAGLLADLNEQQRVDAYQLISQNDGAFKDNLDRYKYSDRYPEKSAQYYRQSAELFLSDLDKRLEQNHYLLGQKPSIADLAIFPFIRQFAFVDKAWFDQSSYSQLQRWLEQHLASDGFDHCMMKLEPWQPNDQPIEFPFTQITHA